MQAKNLINHVVLVVDRSYSMSSLRNDTIRVFDNLIAQLADDSKLVGQETRVSVYLFGSKIECVIYDMDVLRLPSLSSLYQIEGNTKLIDATVQAIDELGEIPTKYGDHSFLLYVLTDGQENESRNTAAALRTRIQSRSAYWTFAAFVPNRNHVGEAARFGFPTDNIMVWNTDSVGLKDFGTRVKTVTRSYMNARAKGIRSTSSLFKLDISNLNTQAVKRHLDKLSRNEYVIVPVRKEGSEVRTFCEYNGQIGEYNKGNAFYQLSKSEKIQANKQICLRDKLTGAVYTGDEARDLLKLPDFEVKVSPTDFGKYDIFVQSTSVNRKLVKGTELLYMF